MKDLTRVFDPHQFELNWFEIIDMVSQKCVCAKYTDMHAILHAREYGVSVHADCNHMYDEHPYGAHLEAVFKNAVKFLHCGFVASGSDGTVVFLDQAVNALAACWVHDAIEDARQTYNDVKAECGVGVADIAYALTNEKGKTRAERANNAYYTGIRAQPGAAFVKVCDRIANLEYSMQRGSSMRTAYAKEAKHFKDMLWTEALDPMFDHIDNLLNVTPINLDAQISKSDLLFKIHADAIWEIPSVETHVEDYLGSPTQTGK